MLRPRRAELMLVAVFALGLLCGCPAAKVGNSGSDSSSGSGSTVGTTASSTTAGSSGSHGSTSGASTAGPGASSSSGGHGSTTGTASNTGSSSSSSTTTSSSSTGSSGGTGSGRPFPDTSSTIAILADQLPGPLTSAQQQFVVDHYVGTQKLTLAYSQPLRALKPDFLVLHYHLAMWQSAQGVDFIIDGNNWGNDYSTVTTHDDWFWHNADGGRVASDQDGKWLMNVSSAGFQQYWADSIAQQVGAGDYDGIFLDSASPALLNFEASQDDPRLAGTAARDTVFDELGNQTFIDAWQTWITQLDGALAARGIPLIPNTSAFTTSWDNTNYGLSAGIFAEGFSAPSFAESDWQASTDEILTLVAADKIVILQNYLSDPTDLATRRYYLANYLLVKGSHTYLDYFAAGPLEWYPEWTLDLGAAQTSATDVSQLLQNGVYRRDFANGIVLVNPSGSDVSVSLGNTFHRVEPSGGGAVDSNGDEPGTLSYSDVTQITVPAQGAEILTR
jgi:hypothetical protein